MNLRTIVSPLAAALAVAIITVPAAASADDSRAEHGDRFMPAKKGEKGKKARASFPMPAEKFSAHVQKRLSHVATKINSRLEKSDLTAAQKTAIKNDLAAGQAQIAAAVTKVSADGTVTKEEAKQVREVTKTVRKETKAKYGKILPQNADKRKARKERRDQKGDKARREGR